VKYSTHLHQVYQKFKLPAIFKREEKKDEIADNAMKAEV